MDMQARQGRRPLYGGLIIVGIVATALLIFFLDDLRGMFERRYTIVALVPDAPGLAAGSPVWVGGKLVGEVKQVGFMPSGADTLDRVWVTLRLPTHVQPQVREDSRVRLTATSLIGESVVDILPGSIAAPILAPGDTLRIRARPTADGVTRRAGVVRGQLDTLLLTVAELTPLARQRLDALQVSFARLDGARVEVERIRADLAANPGAALLRDTAFTASLERARRHAADIPAAVADLGEQFRLTGDMGPAWTRLQARADTLRSQLAAAEAMLDNTDGFVGRFGQDAALRNAIGAARASLDSLVTEARRNPLRFVF
jgi:ABC-type transporter Mla subunit MlaD